MTTIWLVLIPSATVILIIYMALSRYRGRPGETAMEAYVDGLKYLTAGDEQTAFIKFRQAVDQDTGNVDAYLKMGDIFRNRGFTEKALQVHRELTLRLDLSSEIKLEIEKSLAQDYIKAGNSVKAYEILERLSKDNSSRVWAAERLLDLYMKDRKWKEACEIYQDALKKSAQGDNSLLSGLKLMVGRELHQNEEYHKARLIYKEALSINRANPLPYLYIAESYLEEKRVDDGLTFLKRLCEEVPRHAYLAFPLLEETLFHLGRYGEIEDIYHNLLDNDSANIPAKIALAGILEKKGELSSAESLLKSVIDFDPTNILAALRLVNILAARDRVDDGLNILSNVGDKIHLRSQEFKCRKCGKGSSRPVPICPHCNTIGIFN
jgi:lipopolysaccharide biosynthesis regulator YciM